MLVVLRFTLTLAAGLAFAVPAASQDRVGAVSYLDGPVLLHHRFVPAAGRVGAVLMDGDALQTAGGRAEVTFLDGTILHLDSHTRVAFNERGRFQLIDGRIFISTSGISASGYIADTPSALVRLMPRGIFGIMTEGRSQDLLLRVITGDARVESRWGAEIVRAHHTAFVSGPTGRPFVSAHIGTTPDGFEAWSAPRTMTARQGQEPPPAITGYRESQEAGTVIIDSSPRFGPYGRPIPREHTGSVDRGHRERDRRSRGERPGRAREEDTAAPSAPPRASAPQPTAPPATGSFQSLVKPRS